MLVPRPLLAVTLALLVARLALVVHDSRHPRPPATAVRWRTAAEAESESEASGRPILLDFSASWCRPCKLMQHEVFAEPRHAAFVEAGFVPVRVEDGLEADGLDEAGRAALRARYEVRRYPTLLVVRGGEVLARHSGYSEARATLEFLRSHAATRVSGR